MRIASYLLITASLILGILELAGVISIGILWILSPIWIPMLLAIAVFLLALLWLAVFNCLTIALEVLSTCWTREFWQDLGKNRIKSH